MNDTATAAPFVGIPRLMHATPAASEERQQLALRAAGAGVWSIDFAAGLVDCDAQVASILGYPAVAFSLTLADFTAVIYPADQARVHEALQAAMAQRQPLQVEYRVSWPDGTVRHVAGAGLPSYSPQGQLLCLTGLLRDVTATHAAAQQLRLKQEFTQRLLENSVDGIAAVDARGRLTAWNARIAEYTGWPAAEVLGRPVLDIVGHFDTPTHRNSFRRVLAGESVTLLSQPFRFREGHYDAYLVPLRDGSNPAAETPVGGVLCIVRDVTERDRLAEEATQLRLRQQKEVLAAVLDTQEIERKRIAEALHNGLGQLLYATKLQLEGINSPAAKAAQHLLKEAILATRSISFELTPGILEDFGLRAALEEIVKRIAPRQLRVHLHPVGLDQSLPAAVEIAVYRISQELLNNVMKHAQATEARLYVVREGQRLELTVEDNGIGFDAARLTIEPLGGIGLAGVRNRVQLLGGTLDINSRPGKGTVVSIELGV